MDKDAARAHLERWGPYVGSSDTPAAIAAVLAAWADAERALDELRARARTEWGCQRPGEPLTRGPMLTETRARAVLLPGETLVQRDAHAPGPWRPAP